MIEQWFDLNGATLRVMAGDNSLLAPLLPYLDELKSKACSQADVILSITRSAERKPPEHAEVIFEGRLPDGVDGQLLMDRTGAPSLMVPGKIALDITADRTGARMSVRRGSEALIGGSAGLYLIATVLATSGQQLLHAAAVRLPGTQNAILLFAPSGAGKTTAVLALALDGYGLLTDDASVLATGGAVSRDPHRIWGLPRSLKVHQRTAEMLPPIGALLSNRWNSEGEQALTRNALGAVADICAPKPLALVAIWVLGPRAPGSHAIRPIKRSDALARVAADNVFRAPRGMLPDDLRRFQSLSRIVADVPVWELSVGPELSTLGQAVASALSSSSRTETRRACGM